MEIEVKHIFRTKIIDSMSMPLSGITFRDIRLPKVKNKAFAVIGMRRSGKTTFLKQCMEGRISEGAPRGSLLYFNFEDERLQNLEVAHLGWLVEEYYALYPQYRDSQRASFFFDEIQLIPGWETFVRRLLDTESVDIFISGSSAKLLSREVATSMRGRAMEVLVHPFSFREMLRHQNLVPKVSWDRLPKAEKSALEQQFRFYARAGGFPEAQGLESADRMRLLETYVDVAILRDVIERHSVGNISALRWLQRHLLSNPAGPFSVQKFFNTLKSQGFHIGITTLHEYLSHLEDAFLVRTVSLHTKSERQRMVNPRKAYPIDTGLIPLYTETEAFVSGHALETLLFLEMERREWKVGYLKTSEGWEVDFYARTPEGEEFLIQVCADLSNADTFDRETRALESARKLYPKAQPIVISGESIPPKYKFPAKIHWQSAIGWLLG